MKTAGNILGWAVILYVLLFAFWLMLGMGCMQEGYSAAECRDNTLSHVVAKIYPFVK